ncbi:E3 ubiquitin-protein ligase cblA-like [Monomorium pharaonis]|uniref:E3 ubiquitin-protein ligase cblA-like n=1 Tax=Monomorium pharaonis TaxID=307658 RepID=UPI001746EF7A|nr:E3 ubiquitin-protein ligase cblA-like [Monomorium pharaonis]
MTGEGTSAVTGLWTGYLLSQQLLATRIPPQNQRERPRCAHRIQHPKPISSSKSIVYAFFYAFLCLYIWSMMNIRKLKKVIIDQRIDLCRLQNNLQARRPQTRTNKERNSMILQKQNNLVENRLSVSEFLELFSQFYQIYLYNSETINKEILNTENENEICTDFLSENFNSTSTETLRTADNNVDISDESLTIIQRQNSVENERMGSPIQRNRYPVDEPSTSTTYTALRTADNNIDISDESLTIIQRQNSVENERMDSPIQRNIYPADEPSTSTTYTEDIYNIPEDDFGYWYEKQENTTENDVPYYEVNRHFLETCEENQGTVRPERTCIACINTKSNQVFIPCGHICCCEDCANYIMQESDDVKKCPICKKQISAIYKVYTYTL